VLGAGTNLAVSFEAPGAPAPNSVTQALLQPWLQVYQALYTALQQCTPGQVGDNDIYCLTCRLANWFCRGLQLLQWLRDDCYTLATWAAEADSREQHQLDAAVAHLQNPAHACQAVAVSGSPAPALRARAAYKEAIRLQVRECIKDLRELFRPFETALLCSFLQTQVTDFADTHGLELI